LYHGQGKETLTIGATSTGSWDNNIKVGFHRITRVNGSIAIVLFQNNKVVKSHGIWINDNGMQTVGELIDTPNYNKNLHKITINNAGLRLAGIFNDSQLVEEWSQTKLYSYLKNQYPDFLEFDNYKPVSNVLNSKINIPSIPPPPDMPSFIAVIDLVGNNISDAESKALTDRLRIELFNTRHFNVVERGMMEEILDEQGLQQSGCTTNECIVEVGQLIGVDKMIGGSVSKVGNTYSVSSRIVSVETASILHTTTYDFRGEIDELLTSGMKKVAIDLIK